MFFFLYFLLAILPTSNSFSIIHKKFFLSLCSPDANTSLIPSLSLTMKGGSQFAVYDPLIVISTQVLLCSYFFFPGVICRFLRMVIIFLANDLQSELLYCLAIVKSAELNIIGRKSLNLQVI